MSLISLPFFLFFLITTFVYYVLPQKLQWVWLLFVSAYFYYSNATYAQDFLFIAFLLINWSVSLLFSKRKEHKKRIYVFLLIFDILFLAVFKYSEFFLNVLLKFVHIFDSEASLETFHFISQTLISYCPPRISYFALIVIGYVTDVYWEKTPVQRNFGKMALFSGFFPQMTSGPIVTYDQMENELFGEKKHFSYDNFVSGMERVLWGIFKKIVIAERLAVVVNTIYGSYEVYPGFYVLVAAALFAMQLYCDFSGLMDIVLGYSKCLSISLPENFDTPFYSLNLSEFWRRWHITLGAFLRDYVMYPIQRSDSFRKLRKKCKEKFGKGYEKKFNLPLYFSLLISWFLIGLWHGGGFNYIFGVGLYMWFVIVLGELCAPFFAWIVRVLHINTECDSYRLFLRIRTFLFFIFGLSFFRANSLGDGLLMWKNAFSSFNPWIFFDHSLLELGLSHSEWNIVILGLVLLFIVSYISSKQDISKWIASQNFIFKVLVFAVLFIMVICFGYYGMNFNAADFIYGRF